MGLSQKNSLRRQITNRIKSQHKEILPPASSFFKRYLNYLSQRDKGWLVFLHVIFLLFTFSFVRLDIFSFVAFEGNTPEIIIDQRTSNVATIISMTLAVIGLLLSNLAVKDNLTYKLLFVHSRLYLILYYTLSVIACLITISTLRNTLDIDIFRRFVLAGTYLAIFILLGIGYLFRTIINFAIANSIEQILSQKLVDEAKENLKTILLAKYSAEMFLELMMRKNIGRYTLRMAMTTVEAGNNNTAQKYQERLIYDINLQQLEKELGKPKHGDQLFYTAPLSLNLVTNEYETFIYPNKGEKKQLMNLSKCIKTMKKENRLTGSDEYKAYFDGKLMEYSKEGKHSKVEGILSYYHELYLLEMRNGI